MTISEILKELEPYTGRFPMKAMRAAVEQHEAITPELLRVLETAAENPVEFAKREDYMLHVFALFLLAQFREKRAYPLAARIFSAPGEVPFDLFGDTVTEGLSQILGSVYDGDPTPLEKLIESEDVNEYVRNAAIDAFLVLEHSEQMPREQVVGYFQRLFGGRLQRTHSHAWNGLVSAVGDMPAPELLEDVRRAYEDGLVDPGFASLEGIERDLRSRPEGRRERHYVITDAIAEMEWWASFHLEDSRPTKLPKLETLPPPPAPLPSSYVAPRPFVREPKIGRNDPCPCGSGKKHKKCCGKG
jgi:hypothetical protein